MPLGFGCGPLGIGLSPAESSRLLRTAIDCGITYFDTARMYGWGRAEGILGELTPRNRDGIIVASKAGILPPNRSLPRRIVSRGVRFLHEAAPRTRGYIAGPEVWQPRYGVFKVPELQKSIETSLKELRTDYLDIFLLHECKERDVQNPELLDFLQGLKTQGKIREFGIATGIEETIAIARMRPVLASVLQVPNNIWEANMARLPAKSAALTITHSCFGSRFRALRNRLSSDDSLARDWKSMTQVDPHDTPTMAQLILAHALRANASGIVLFSSSKPVNIIANARAVEDNIIENAQIDGLNAFMARDVMRLAGLGSTDDYS
jgi:D-threo-aldose 1-dehydrogenase